MVKSIKNSLGQDFKTYASFSYPTTNFGTLTSYEGELNPANQVCAMSSCLDNLDLSGERDQLDFKGLLDVGTGGSISLSEKQQKDASIDGVLPKLWSILSVDGDFSKSKTKNIKLNLGPAHVRFLNKLELRKYIDALPDEDYYKQKFINGDLVVIVSDVVVSEMSVTVEIDSETALNLEAAVSAYDEASQGKDIKLKFDYKKISNGKYQFDVNQPVIVMRLPKKQPTAGGLGLTDDFGDWLPVTDFIQNEELD